MLARQVLHAGCDAQLDVDTVSVGFYCPRCGAYADRDHGNLLIHDAVNFHTCQIVVEY